MRFLFGVFDVPVALLKNKVFIIQVGDYYIISDLLSETISD